MGYFSSNDTLLHSLFWNRNDALFFHESDLFLVSASVSIWVRLCMEIYLCKWRGNYYLPHSHWSNLSVILFYRIFLKSNFLEAKYCHFPLLSYFYTVQTAMAFPSLFMCLTYLHCFSCYFASVCHFPESTAFWLLSPISVGSYMDPAHCC